jgi:hypothetical protein
MNASLVELEVVAFADTPGIERDLGNDDAQRVSDTTNDQPHGAGL